MVDNPTNTAPATDFPPPQFPVVFADGVRSIANSPSVVKFFLFRHEPSISGSGQSITQVFSQVVMPMDAFVQTFAFFEAAVNRYIEQGLVKKERVDEFREGNRDVKWTTG